MYFDIAKDSLVMDREDYLSGLKNKTVVVVYEIIYSREL